MWLVYGKEEHIEYSHPRRHRPFAHHRGSRQLYQDQGHIVHLSWHHRRLWHIKYKVSFHCDQIFRLTFSMQKSRESKMFLLRNGHFSTSTL